MEAERLAAVPLFDGMTDEERASCAARFEVVEVLSDHNVTREGDFSYAFFVVLEGEVEVHHEFNHLATLKPGEFFGEMGLDSGDRRNAHVVTRGRALLAKMMTWDFEQMLEENPALAERIHETIKARTATDE